MADPLKYFRVEAREILEQLQSGVLELERTGEGVSKLLRLAHTLKGAARVVKQLEIANLAHQLEELLVPLRHSPQPLAPRRNEGLLAAVDTLNALVTGLATRPAPEPAGAAPPKQAGAISAREEPPFAPKLEHVDDLMDGLAEVALQLSSLRQTLPGLARSRNLAEQLTERLDPRRGELDRASLTVLSGLASELEGALRALERTASTGVDRATRELSQVRDRVDQLQLVSAASMFGALERTTRDAAVSLDRSARFEARGGEIRLDAEVLSAVQRALVQAVRNAVAHGIEPSAERATLGKPTVGRVLVEVERRGHRIDFSCQDDGRGIDLKKVWQEAERLGRVTPLPTQPDEQELVTLLLQGGISTSTTVTEVAGRGVGLDLIREALSNVGGDVSLSTSPGRGTTLRLSVPTSLSALEGLVVEAGAQVCALPLDAVVRAVRVSSAELHRTASETALPFEGQLVPFSPLAWLLGNAAPTSLERHTWSVVVVRAHEGLLALGVDRLLGNEGLVARRLPDSIDASAVVASATLDSDGNPQLLLDPDGLLTAARRSRPRVATSDKARPVILVVDDSLTTRMLEQSILESAGYEVELATSGEQGLEKARARKFDLLLIDVEMPGIDGFEFIRQLRADSQLSSTPAVLVTSRVSPEDLARGRAVGADGHIAKGEFDQVAFLDLIGGLVA
jgi:two-component system chemotaxis sensor kinase CheA